MRGDKLLFSKDKSGQGAVEFLILVGGVLFFFVVFLFIIQEDTADKLNERKNLALKEIASIVKDEIAFAFESIDGYYRNFELPNTLDGINYDVSIVNEFVYARTTDGRHALALPVLNVTGQPIIGSNAIRKINGTVFLN